MKTPFSTVFCERENKTFVKFISLFIYKVPHAAVKT